MAPGESLSRSAGSGVDESPRLTNTISGLSVRSWNQRISFSSSDRSDRSRGDCPASRAACTFFTMSSSAWSCSFSLAGLFASAGTSACRPGCDRMSRSAKSSSSRNRVSCSARLVAPKPSRTTSSPFASRRMPRRRGLSLRSSSIRPGVSRKAMAAYLVPFFGLKWAPACRGARRARPPWPSGPAAPWPRPGRRRSAIETRCSCPIRSSRPARLSLLRFRVRGVKRLLYARQRDLPADEFGARVVRRSELPACSPLPLRRPRCRCPKNPRILGHSGLRESNTSPWQW